MGPVKDQFHSAPIRTGHMTKMVVTRHPVTGILPEDSVGLTADRIAEAVPGNKLGKMGGRQRLP